MKSIRDIYKIGKGPSSSHTIGPQRIAEYTIRQFGNQDYEVELFGSLALTGIGHGTDRVLTDILGSNTNIVYNKTEKNLEHPNTMDIYIVKDHKKEKVVHALSIGGGDVVINGVDVCAGPDIYPHNHFTEIKEYCIDNKITLPEYVSWFEADVFEYLKTVWITMKESVVRGLNTDGKLKGGLNLYRKAKELFEEDGRYENTIITENRKLSSYALAVAEENASNGTICTAPTCGAAGVVPAVLYYMSENYHVKDDEIIKALAVAGMIGNVVKQNASISGAECGCQAEIGVACAMAAAALAQINELDICIIECAAEIGLEHHLGLTCDPVLGLVQIPCIERNAMAACMASNAMMLAKSLESKHLISFDKVVEVMYKTGKDMQDGYKETSTGGLAKLYT